MKGILLYCAGNSPAMPFACRNLEDRGFEFAPTAAPDVTHLLLSVPSFDDSGHLRDGGDLGDLLARLPKTVTVLGGNLHHPLLEGYATIDLLQDAWYLAQNAAITADCALQVARNHLPVVLERCPVLVLGWGRIGKCLAKLLKATGAHVTVAARKETDLAMLQALGYEAEQTEKLRFGLVKYRLIFNTVPHLVLDQDQICHCGSDCVKIELASCPGIAGTDVIQARGLPGKMAPESAGLLIAKSVIRQIAPKEV